MRVEQNESGRGIVEVKKEVKTLSIQKVVWQQNQRVRKWSMTSFGVTKVLQNPSHTLKECSCVPGFEQKTSLYSVVRTMSG